MLPPATAAATVQVSAVPARAGIAGDSVEEVSVAALAERVGDFNVSMDPWERVGATPAPDSDSSPGIYSTTTPRHYSLRRM